MLFALLVPMKHWIFFLICLAFSARAQDKARSVRGLVTDKKTGQPLAGATVTLEGSTQGVFTAENGEFILTNVPLGRRTVRVNFMGYEPFTMADFIVQSIPEPYLTLALTEVSREIREVVVTAARNAYEPLNDLSVVSTRSFTAEEAERMPAGVNDPGRMALSYPGVQRGQDDSENQIVVRGNSPTGILWRLEGIDIPNPNHFALIGSSGGGITVFSSQLVARSDFSTGGFAAEYGNALSGVFDVRFRPGNNRERQSRFKLGVLGIDFATEGPLRKGSSSYLVNYRYSTLGLLSSMGFYLVGERVINNFQDLSFNLVFRGRKSVHTVFGMGGLSEEHYLPVEDPGSRQAGVASHWEDRVKPANMGALGYTWTRMLSRGSVLKTVVAVVGSDIRRRSDTLDRDDRRFRYETQKYTDKRVVATMVYQARLGARSTLKTGLIGHLIRFDFYRDVKDRSSLSDVNQLRGAVSVEGNGSTVQLQQYAQVQTRLFPGLSLNYGYHYLRLSANGTQSLDPRISLQYLPKENHRLSLAYGLYSRTLPLMAYYVKDSLGVFLNKNLGLLKAQHWVASYQVYTPSKIRWVLEAYYQKLGNVPVEPDKTSNYWMLNNSSEFPVTKMVSEGTGRNYGVDATIEKMFSNSYYFVVTGSWMNSTYRTLNGVRLNTRFNSGYTTAVTGGKEFSLKNGNTLQAGARYLLSGGFRYTPYDPLRSAAERRYVEMKDADFSAQVPAYRRLDARFAYRYNARKLSGNISLDIQNLFNRINASSVYYDAKSNTTGIFYGSSGLVPVITFQFDF